MDNREADDRLQRFADFCQRLPLLGIEHTDEIVVAIIAAVFILYLEAAIIGRLKHRAQGIVLGHRDTGNRIRSGLGVIDFHIYSFYPHPVARRGAAFDLFYREYLLPSDSRYSAGPICPSNDIRHIATVLYVVHEFVNYAVALQPEALTRRKFIDPSSRLQIFG